MTSKLIDVLGEEHQGFQAMLSVLAALASRVSSRGAVPPTMVADIIDFFQLFTDRHHALEEQVLFPALAKHGVSRDQTVVNALLAQHDAGRMYCRKMHADQQRMSQGDDSAADDFAAHALCYCELIREHIRIEDEYFYGLAVELLTEAELQSVLNEFSSRGGGAAHPQRARFLRMLEEFPAIAASWQ